jgi:hypothetical protein
MLTQKAVNGLGRERGSMNGTISAGVNFDSDPVRALADHGRESAPAT